MPVACELKPRLDIAPEDFKRLGAALTEWARQELGGDGVLSSIDRQGLASLIGGEPPNPLAVEAAAHHQDVPLEQIRQDLGPLASERSLRFNVKDGVPRGQVVASLRQAIPTELVEDVIIDDVSWAA
jgi:hypothetical protein